MTAEGRATKTPTTAMIASTDNAINVTIAGWVWVLRWGFLVDTCPYLKLHMLKGSEKNPCLFWKGALIYLQSRESRMVLDFPLEREILWFRLYARWLASSIRILCMAAGQTTIHQMAGFSIFHWMQEADGFSIGGMKHSHICNITTSSWTTSLRLSQQPDDRIDPTF